MANAIEENARPSPAGSRYELSVMAPPSVGSQAQLTVLERSEPVEGTTFQELAPVDRGIAAWTFCASGFVAEMFIWGFLFRQVLYVPS